jgi:hypothetical protein
MAISKCIEPNCTRRARETKTGKCRKHGGGPRCTESDCKTSAWDDGSGKCKKHGGGNCTEEGCKNKTRGKSGKCLDHGGGKCKEPGCTNSGSADKTGKCRKHGGHKCNEPDCKSNARDNSSKCRKHGGGKCSEPGCKTNCVGGQYKKCMTHGPRCLECKYAARSHLDYDGHCANCFKYKFPNDPRSNKVHEHSKELRVRNAINETFEGFIHDKPLFTGECDCTHRRRIDHRRLIGSTLLCVETDEFAHRDYNEKDEEIRYDDLYMVHSGKWVFIRFNPDGKGVHINDKIEQLLDEIETQIQRIKRDENAELLEIIKMFY